MSIITCTCLLFAFMGCVLSYPWSESTISTLLPRSDCDTQDETMILCQTCAKSTKSNIVYPMCCLDQEEARNWCYHYITFGIQGQ